MLGNLIIFSTLCALACKASVLDNTVKSDPVPTPCTCGIFLSGQFKKGTKEQPKGEPVLTQEMDNPFMNNSVGNRQCINKCLELVRKRHLVY